MFTKKMFVRLFFSTKILLLASTSASAQVTIGSGNPPSPFSLLDLDASLNPKALHLPRLTEIERDALVTPDSPQADRELANGLMIFNIGSECLEFWNGEVWISLCYDRDNGGGDCPPCEPVTIAVIQIVQEFVELNDSVDFRVGADGSSREKTYTWQIRLGDYWDDDLSIIVEGNWEAFATTTVPTYTISYNENEDLWLKMWAHVLEDANPELAPRFRVKVNNYCSSSLTQSNEVQLIVRFSE